MAVITVTSGKTFAECALGENTHHWTHNYTALAEQLLHK
jgi:hypothetical protein